jgi:hypothetical protein
MYLTNLKLSAAALFFSVALVLGAAHFQPGPAAETCVECPQDALGPAVEAVSADHPMESGCAPTGWEASVG